MADKSTAGMMSQENDRKAQIVRVSIIGIIANVALAAFKAAVGLLSNSIAIVLDAVNNLSDAASSIITIVGTRLAGKQPGKHPVCLDSQDDSGRPVQQKSEHLHFALAKGSQFIFKDLPIHFLFLLCQYRFQGVDKGFQPRLVLFSEAAEQRAVDVEYAADRAVSIDPAGNLFR